MGIQHVLARAHHTNDMVTLPFTQCPQRGRHRPLLVYGSGPGDESLIFSLRAAGWNVGIAGKASSTRSLINRCPIEVGLVFINSRCNQARLDEIEQVLAENTSMLWIALLSAPCTDSPAINRLITAYCHDFYTQPFHIDKLMGTLGHAYGIKQLQSRAAGFDDSRDMYGLVGSSAPMLKLQQDIRKVARVDAAVLLTGESGSGKELSANAVHQLSARSGQPFVSVNCAALPKDLVHSELFGHEKGSFTGACKRHIGYFEAANNGTIFLDEIGDLPVNLQINLLRFLEEKVIERIGSTNKLPINARVIAATNQNLEKAVDEGRFREDLYFRLNVLHLEVPSLKEHLDDIDQIAEHIFEQYINEKRPGIRGFSKQALRAMHHYHWPGNVRELINRVRQAMVMSEGRLISPADLGLTGEVQSHATLTLENSRALAAKNAIEMALKNTCNNISQSARELDISRTTLYRLMSQFSIEV